MTATAAELELEAVPAYLTRRDPALRSIGNETAATSLVLGRRLIPWQRQAADVLGTLRPDGRFRYTRGAVIVPRRAGKSWLLLCHALTVNRLRRRSRSFYANHRRETAAAMWRDDWFPTIEQSQFARWTSCRKSNGSEAVTFHRESSTFRLMPPDGDAMRSFASDLANIDEAREFDDEAGRQFERAVLPTQATGLGGQFLLWSNAGTASSTWLARWRDIGRASVTDPTSSVVYCEYAAPDDADISDPAVWRANHPGIGYHVNLDAVAADYETLAPDDFAAEYLGLWPETQVDTELVAAWLELEVADVAPVDPVTFAVETSIDRTRTVIVVAGTASSDPTRPAVELVDDRPHGPWVVDRLAELVTEWRPSGLVWDAGGPVAALTRELDTLAVNRYPYRTADVAAAAGAYHDRVIGGAVCHRGDPELAESIAAARRRPTAGAWLFDRRQPGALATIAASLAVWRWSDGRGRAPTVT